MLPKRNCLRCLARWVKLSRVLEQIWYLSTQYEAKPFLRSSYYVRPVVFFLYPETCISWQRVLTGSAAVATQVLRMACLVLMLVNVCTGFRELLGGRTSRMYWQMHYPRNVARRSTIPPLLPSASALLSDPSLTEPITKSSQNP